MYRKFTSKTFVDLTGIQVVKRHVKAISSSDKIACMVDEKCRVDHAWFAVAE